MSASEFQAMIKTGMITSGKKGKLVFNDDNVPGIEKVAKKLAKKKSKPKKQKPRCPVTGIEYDSMGEIYLSWWLNELQGNGFIYKWTAQPKSFQLTEEVSRTVIKRKQLKTKVKVEEKKEVILKGHLYTADFKIHWTPKAYKYNLAKEFDLEDTRPKLPGTMYAFGGETYLEAKPDGLDLKRTIDKNNMVRLFSNKQKEVYDKHDILVELIYHNKLFSQTFVPFRYLTTDVSGDNRSIKYKVQLIKEFIDNIKIEKDGELF